MKSPDVELVEPEAVLVKQEKVEANMSQETEEDVPLIGDDGEYSVSSSNSKYYSACVCCAVLCCKTESI